MTRTTLVIEITLSVPVRLEIIGDSTNTGDDRTSTQGTRPIIVSHYVDQSGNVTVSEVQAAVAEYVRTHEDELITDAQNAENAE